MSNEPLDLDETEKAIRATWIHVAPGHSEEELQASPSMRAVRELRRHRAAWKEIAVPMKKLDEGGEYTPPIYIREVVNLVRQKLAEFEVKP